MSTTTNNGANDLRIVKDPTTPKESAIIDAVLDDPKASHATIADRVEDSIGERPDPSWVSRVRSSFIREAEADDYDATKVDDIVARLDRVEDAVDDAARTRDVDRTIEAVECLAESVETLIDEMRDVQATVEMVDDMVARDISDDVVAHVLRQELDRVESTPDS